MNYLTIGELSEKWRCNRCNDVAKETAECQMCQLRGGALQPAAGYGFAHVICALFNSLAHFVDPVKKQPIRIDPPAERSMLLIQSVDYDYDGNTLTVMLRVTMHLCTSFSISINVNCHCQ